jgi:hypothetical protein
VRFFKTEGDRLSVRTAEQVGSVYPGKKVIGTLTWERSAESAHRGYDADWIRAFDRQHGAWANIPPKRNRTEALCFSRYLYRARNLVERFFNKIKHCRRVATATTSSRPITSHSSSLRQCVYGWTLMSPRPGAADLTLLSALAREQRQIQSHTKFPAFSYSGTAQAPAWSKAERSETASQTSRAVPV